jgi:hypothetical protein
MLENNSPGAPRINEAATLKSGAAPGGSPASNSAQHATDARPPYRYSLWFLVSLIAKPDRNDPPQDHS